MDLFLALIEDAFSDVLRRWGFTAERRAHAASPFYTEAVVYVNGGRSIAVSYAQTRERWCEVEITGYGDFEPVTDLFGFVRWCSESDGEHVSTNDPVVFASEAKRCCALLVQYSGKFLEGDIVGFRSEYRELFLVTSVRNARNNADASMNWAEFTRYHQCLTDYWTQGDLDAAKSARHRGWRP